MRSANFPDMILRIVVEAVFAALVIFGWLVSSCLIASKIVVERPAR